MTKKLQQRFITVGMLSALVVVIIVMCIINFANHFQNISQADSMLSYLVENDGDFPGNLPSAEPDIPNYEAASPETYYSTRFFSVWIKDGTIEKINTQSIAALSQSEVEEYALYVYNNDKSGGYLDEYRYSVSSKGDQTLIVFLDCLQTRTSEKRIMTLSVIIAVGALLCIFILLYLFSKRVVAPIAESSEKQKRFITDASHELKTPLAVLLANTEIIEAQNGTSEWTESSRHQIDRMTQLVGQLMTLASLNEVEENVQLEETDITELISSEVTPFKAVAANKGKTLSSDIALDMHGKVNIKHLREVTSILVDNAIKYSDENGEIKISAYINQKKHTLNMSVSNPCESANKDEVSHFFDRFYRTDSSRSRETGGSGIGLSIASAVAQTYNGKLSAKCSDEKIITFNLILPI
ncbi:MAG: HAMP domain-containing histidine kinase [Clostridiales bacterium]|nr:HAMP domain-containing histidine kinase [Clostridiales bacterium]